MSWRVATALEVLRAEINDVAPNRSTISDGSIGDAAHASRSSDHNPWRPGSTVGARDFTHDPAHGLDCNDLATHLAGMIAAGDHPALGSGAYIIWNWRILSTDRRREGWRRYTGSNGHTQHLHLSVATAAAGFDSTRPWGWDNDQEDDMADEKTQKTLGSILANTERLLTETQVDRERDQRQLEADRKNRREVRRQLGKLREQASDDATRQQAMKIMDLLDAAEGDVA